MDKIETVFAAGLLCALSCVNLSDPDSISGSRATVEGYVCDGTGKGGLQAVRVGAIGTTSETQTDTNGYFRISFPYAGDSALVHFERTHFAPRIIAVLPTGGELLIIEDTIFLSRTYGVIGGIVFDSLSGSPAPAATVILSATLDNTVIDSAQTDTAGRFCFRYIAPDSAGYTVSTEKSGFSPHSVSRRVQSADSLFLTIAAQKLMRIYATIIDSALLLPVAGAVVSAQGDTAITDTNGIFSLSDIAIHDSGIVFAVNADYYQPAYMRDTLVYADSVLDTVLLTRARGAIRGTVTLQGQNDHRDAAVAIDAVAAGYTTDAAGYFAIANVPAGKHRISFSRPGFRAHTDSVNLAGNDTVSLLPELIIESGNIRTPIEWTMNHSPYYVRDSLVVKNGGRLLATHGTEIIFDTGAVLSAQTDGLILTDGTKLHPVTIRAADTLSGLPRLHMRGAGSRPILDYTTITNVPVYCTGESRLSHTLFIRSQSSDSSRLLELDTDEFSSYITNCDFISVDASLLPVILRGDSTNGYIHFSRCIFYQSATTDSCGYFLRTRAASPSPDISVNSCNFYANCIAAQPILGAVSADTANITVGDPGYSDVGASDFHLSKTSSLLGTAPYENHYGALGLNEPVELEQ